MYKEVRPGEWMPEDEIVEPPVAVVIADANEQVEAVSEQLDEAEIDDEARYNVLLKGINECRAALTNLSQSTTPTESPVQNQILVEVAEIKAKVQQIELALQNRPNQSKPNTSTLPPSQSETNLEEPEMVELTDEPSPVARVEKRYRKL
jgi:hypothetical protein